ncbi:Flagellum-specific ATP synthase [Buchnera aphidicola (Takecallis arundicolens)]|uniref:FliI/YscN family ATPase n=1 Tax=Buchnera aphidicola TaxID=9 RepID=UPI0034643AC4
MNIRVSNWCKQLNKFSKHIDYIPDVMNFGRVVGLTGVLIEVIGLKVPIDTVCIIEFLKNNQIIHVEGIVINFSLQKTFLTLFENIYTIPPDARVFPKFNQHFYTQKWPLGFQLLGRILDGQGKPLDNHFLSNINMINTLQYESINPLDREPISEIFDVGVRSINALLTLGKGQKIGLLSQSGYGKSLLIGMMARHAQVDVIIIGLIGERSREIRYFIEHVLGLQGLLRSVIIAVPINTSPILKIQGAMYAMRIAEYFRDHKQDVLLIIDSLTRYAMSEREISVSLGELPVHQGYPSSIFTKLSHFIERAGNFKKNHGSITAFYTILLEQEDNDLVGEIAKSVLDGHIVLSKLYADLGHYPAIDIELSISRLMVNLVNPLYYKKACYLKQLMSTYQRSQDLINVGAYIHGSNTIIDEAIQKWPKIQSFLKQDLTESSSYIQSISLLSNII